MAFDTLIDKAQLEAAMTATADAVRSKLSESEKIDWDNETGFSAAIARLRNINTSGMFVKVGEATVTYTATKLDITSYDFYDKITKDDIYMVPKGFTVFSTDNTATGEITCGTYNVIISYNNGIINLSRASVNGKVGISFPSDIYVYVESEVLGIDKTVELDLADGNQVVSPAYNEAFKNVTIVKPETLIPENIAKDVEIAGVVGAFEGGSGEDYLAMRLNGTLSEYSNSEVTIIGPYIFYDCPQLTSINFPACMSIMTNAFARCPQLTSIDFPVCKSIGDGAFATCSSLRSVSFPACTSIGNSAFCICPSLQSVNFPVCKSIGGRVFASCSSLQSANFPVCTRITTSAFRDCSSLQSVSFPACTSIDNDAFYSCTSLIEANFPVCKTVGSNVFLNCSSLQSANFPACTSIGDYAFYSCSSLQSLDFPICSMTGSYTFYSCTALVYVNFPVCKTTGSCTFKDCFSLTTVSFPECSILHHSTFQNCIALTSVNFPACTSIYQNTFNGCGSVSTLILGASSLCRLTASNAFTSTPIASGTGYIYVPASMVDAYKSATNWTYFSNQFRSIEELPTA